MFKDLREKAKLVKLLLELSKELKRLKKEEQSTFDDIGHFLESAKLLYPKIGGILEKIINIVKSHSNKKV
jgi:hypothetical protein